MTEALFRIPSRTVTYGYVEVSVDLGHADPEIIAATYVSWVHAFQKEEEATIERLKDAPSGAVKAPLAASQPEVDHPVDPVDKAAQMVAEGLGGATEIPWKQEVATPKKPWETETEKPNRPVHPIVTPDW